MKARHGMGWKCVPQVKGLVRSDGMRRDGKGQAKHRANAAAIVNEAFLISDPEDGPPIPFRKSASETYDRTLTKDNKYTGYATADGVMAALEREADAQTVDVRTTDKKTGGTVVRQRPLRSDAVIGLAVIFNPPGPVACHWTPEQNAKFLEDSLDVMGQIQSSIRLDKKGARKAEGLKRSQEECHLFRRENVIAIAEHRDEGEPEESEGVRTPNWHVVYKPEAEDGKYKGNVIDAYSLSYLSVEYARLMRDRGWDIDDPDATDWAKFNGNKEYKEKRKRKIREGGKSVNKYRAAANREKAAAQAKEAQEILDRAAELKQDVEVYAERTRREADAEAERTIAQAEADAAAARREKEQAVAARDAAKQEQAEAEQSRNEAQDQVQLAQMGLNVVNRTMGKMRDEIRSLAEREKEVSEEVGKVKGQLETVKGELGKAVSDRDAARREADELRRTKVAQAERAAVEASRETKDRIVANATASMKDWTEKKKAGTEAAAGRVLAAAEADAAVIRETASGEYEFLLRWLGDPNRTYKSGPHAGMTILDVARMAHEAEIRKGRVSELPSGVRDAGKRQDGTDQDGPAK